MRSFLRPGTLAFALAALASTLSAAIDLTPVWTRLGDPAGGVDQDNGIASVEAAEFSPDGTLIVTGSKRTPRVKLWRVSDGVELWSRDRGVEIEAVAFSPSGTWFAAAGEDLKVEIYRTSDRAVIQTLTAPAGIDAMRFSHDGAILALGAENQRVYLYRTSNWSLIASYLHGGVTGQAVNSIDFSSDDSRLVTAGTNGAVKLWQINSDLTLTFLKDLETPPAGADQTGSPYSVKSVRFSPDDALVTYGGRPGFKVRRVSDKALLFSKSYPGGKVECVEWTPDGTHIAYGGGEGFPTGGLPSYIRFVRASDWRVVHFEPVFRQEYLHFHAGTTTRLVSSHEDGTARLWTLTRPANVFYTLQNAESLTWLDGNSDLTVDLFTNNSGDDKKWEFIPVESAYYLIRNKARNAYLDASTNDTVELKTANTGDDKRWAVIEDLGFLLFMNKATSKFLDREGNLVRQTPDNGANDTRWFIKP